MTNNANSKSILNALHFDNKIIIDPIYDFGSIWVCGNNNNMQLKSFETLVKCAHLFIKFIWLN